MSIKEQSIADWNTWENKQGFPRSWYAADKANDFNLVFAESDASGCISTYKQLQPGQRLDEERIQILLGCREVFIKAQPFITDDEGKWLMELHLRLSAMVLADCGVFDETGEV